MGPAQLFMTNIMCLSLLHPCQVAASAGVKLSEADAALKALAYDSLGNLEVGLCMELVGVRTGVWT
jgi:hypothetical protein